VREMEGNVCKMKMPPLLNRQRVHVLTEASSSCCNRAVVLSLNASSCLLHCTRHHCPAFPPANGCGFQYAYTLIWGF
jgi:hypothetical protein